MKQTGNFCKICLCENTLFIVCLGFVLAANAQRNIDVLHYRFEINLNDTTDTISGRATILVKFLEETDRLAFDFTSVSNGKGMVVFLLWKNLMIIKCLRIRMPRIN